MNISFRKLEDSKKDFDLLYKWCQEEYIYEWFEQRILSYDEIVTKYKNKFGKQELFVIKVDNKDIGFTQIYKYDHDTNISNLDNYTNIYEFDIFIGEKDYLSKGIGTNIVKEINNMIYSKYKADAIILRPFKRNIRAIKCYQKCDYRIIDEYEGKDTLDNPETIVVLLNEKH